MSPMVSLIGQFTVLPAVIVLVIAEAVAYFAKRRHPAKRLAAWVVGLLVGIALLWLGVEAEWLFMAAIAVLVVVATLVLRFPALGAVHFAVAMTIGATIAYAVYTHLNPGDNPSQGAVAYPLLWIYMFLPALIAGLIASVGAGLIRRRPQQAKVAA